ncbi:hypothetical protein B0H17DRAFT_1130415 [Mycena rosella]|uniref:Uncharacterized protein n=1 Tax=Mycena rosella TaxID=1033263 RepID=A0AAD7DQN5_MYCRO|nr:hypothetical protein B0H17DRAFT_1130415 [Mycena rosella]
MANHSGSSFRPSEASPRIPNLLSDADHGYDEEATILAEMKALKARVAAHCANAERKKITTQTTTFLRDVVQHLPENPTQVPGARSAIQANLVRVSNDPLPALMPPASEPTPTQYSAPTWEAPLPTFRDTLRQTQERDLKTYFGGLEAAGLWPVSPLPDSGSVPATRSAQIQQVAWHARPIPDASYPVSTPRGQKRTRDADWDDSPRTYRTCTPDGRVIFTSTPDGRFTHPFSAAAEDRYPASPVPAPPVTPSPSPCKSTGASYLTSTFYARLRTISADTYEPRRGTMLPSSPLGLEGDEIPRFLDDLVLAAREANGDFRDPSAI